MPGYYTVDQKKGIVHYENLQGVAFVRSFVKNSLIPGKDKKSGRTKLIAKWIDWGSKVVDSANNKKEEPLPDDMPPGYHAVNDEDFAGYGSEEEVTAGAAETSRLTALSEDIQDALAKYNILSGSASSISFVGPGDDADTLVRLRGAVPIKGFNAGDPMFINVQKLDQGFETLQNHFQHRNKGDGFDITISPEGNIKLRNTPANQAFMGSIIDNLAGGGSEDYRQGMIGKEWYHLGDIYNNNPRAAEAIAKVVRAYMLDVTKTLVREKQTREIKDHVLTMNHIINKVDTTIAETRKTVKNADEIHQARKEELDDKYTKSEDARVFTKNLVNKLKIIDAATTGEHEIAASDNTEYAAAIGDRWSYVEAHAKYPNENDPRHRVAYMFPTPHPNKKNIPPETREKIEKAVAHLKGMMINREPLVKQFDAVDWQLYIDEKNLMDVNSTGHRTFPPLRIRLVTGTSDRGAQSFVELTDMNGGPQLGGESFFKMAKNRLNYKRGSSQEHKYFAQSAEEQQAAAKRAVSTAENLDTAKDKAAFNVLSKRMTSVVKNMSKAMSIASFDNVLKETFPHGLRIQNANTGKDSLIMFGEGGTMYYAEDPSDPSRWQVISPQIYDMDSPYMNTLKAISALSNENYTTVKKEFISHAGDRVTASIRGLHKKTNKPLTEGMAEFLDWQKGLLADVNATINADPEMKDTLRALSAFPGLSLHEGRAFSSETNNVEATYLLGRVFNNEDDEALQYIRDTVGGGRAFEEASNNYQLFANWMRSRYQLRAEPGSKFYVNHTDKDVQEAHNLLKQELLQAAEGVQEAERVMHQEFFGALPNKIKFIDSDQQMLNEIYNESATGRASLWLKNNLYDPMEKYLVNTIGQFEGILTHIWDLIWDWKKVLKESVPDALVALGAAAKLFVNHFMGSFIDKHFKSKKMELKVAGGKEEYVDMGGVRKHLKSSLQTYAGINVLSAQKLNTLDALIDTPTHEKQLENAEGINFSQKYGAQFKAADFIDKVTKGNREAITISAPLTKRSRTNKERKPRYRIAVDVAILDTRQAIMSDIVKKELAAEGSEGIVVSGESMVKTPPHHLRNWVTDQASRFDVGRFNPHVRGGKHLSGDEIEKGPKSTKLYMDREGVPHIRMEYTFRQMFGSDRYKKAYKNIYHRPMNQKEEGVTMESAKVRLIGRLLLGV